MAGGFDEAAASLGITTEGLMNALGKAQGGQTDMAAVAVKLSSAQGNLRAVLPKFSASECRHVAS